MNHETDAEKICDSTNSASRAGGREWLRLALLVTVYGVTLNIMWWLSRELEVVPGAVSWFIPAGIRVGALVLFKPRHWWLLWLAEAIAFGGFTTLTFDYKNAATALASHGLPFLCYALPFWLLRRIIPRTPHNPFLPFPAVSLGAVAGATLLGLNWTAILINSDVVPAQEWASTLFAIVLGDMVGVCLAMPLLMLKLQDHPLLNSIPLAFAVGAVLAMVVAQFVDLGPGQYYWRILLLLIVGFAAYRFGILGASTSSWSVSILIIGSHLLEGQLGTVHEDQFFIIFSTLGSLALGSAISRQRQLLDELNTGNRALAYSIRELIALNRDHQNLASRLVDLSERERQLMANELHDGLGQLLSSVRVKLQLLKGKSPDNANELDELSGLVGTTYNTARALMYQLSPLSLLDMGLASALCSPELTTLLDAQNIDYRLDVAIDGVELSQNTQLQIYRIVQEAAHNTCKYANAKTFTVRLAPTSQGIELCVADDGRGFDTKTVGRGIGLGSIQDRATVLGAHYELHSDASGTRHQLRFMT